MSVAWLAQPIPLATLAPVQQRLVTGLRHWAAAHRFGRWPVGALQDHLGCGRAAAHLQLLIEEIGLAWPEAFHLSPLCCRRTSHDEALIAAMAGAAAADDRPDFDRLTSEMLGADARERLFLSLALLSDAIATAPAGAAQDRD